MRVLIRHKSRLLKFLVLESSDRDGSLTLIIRRGGVSTSRTMWSTKPGEEEPEEKVFEQPRPKSKRITIHQSGCVNYHENGRTIFIEPLTRITRAICIYRYRVPALEKLDPHPDEMSEENAVFDLSEANDGPVSFSVLVGPPALVPPGKGIKLTYDSEGYSIAVAMDAEAFAVATGYEDYFTTLSPGQGPFVEQQMAEDQAMISYHQALMGSSGLYLHQPNGEGVIRLIFLVPMRIAPKFKIELVDPNLYVAEQDVQKESRSEKVMFKFKVRNRQTKQIIRQPVAVRSIELDAEL